MKLEVNFSLDSDKRRLFEALKMLKKQPYIITIEKKGTRSLRANAYYWGLLAIIEDETGQDQDTCHKYFKKKFLQGSTSVLDSFNFMEYIDKVRAFAIQELDIYLPTPDE